MSFMELFSLRGKRIAVTGGAQGIGACVAGALAGCGAQVGIFDLNADKAAATAAALAKEYGVAVTAHACDVTDAPSVDAAFAAFGTPDAVFNNAGIVLHKAALELTDAEWLSVPNVNLNGVFFVARAAARLMVADGVKGAIVNTASMSGHIVNIPQRQASYNASKAAVIHLTKSLAVEWAEHGVRVNSISPGYIKTEMTGAVNPDWQKQWLSMIPMGRMGTPEELACAVIYLMSAASGYTTGSDIVIDGGFTAV